MTLGDIVKEYRQANSISMDDFAKRCGLSKGYISMLENNINPRNNKPIAPTLPSVKKVASGMFMDLDSLLKIMDADQPISLIPKLTPVKTRKSITINVLGRVAAGIPLDAIEEVIDTEEISAETASAGEFFGLRIDGDSMEPKFSKGDVVIVRKQSSADDGDIVIAMVNGNDAVCKRLKRYHDGIMLISNNSAYDPMIFSKDDIKNKPVRILGKVVELRAKF